jgi:hypothetical protein
MGWEGWKIPNGSYEKVGDKISAKRIGFGGYPTKSMGRRLA